MADQWPTRRLAVASLHLDKKNPRLGRETSPRAPRDVVRYLFEHDKSLEIAESILRRGYFPNEPLLAVQEDNRYVVVEGNRRLAALKAIKEPALLEGELQRKVESAIRRFGHGAQIDRVPVTIAPSRRATDTQLAGRHVGTPVRAWQAENRASFILDKLDEGYSNDDLRDVLGFTLKDIQEARQTRAIAEMSRSLDLPEEVAAKLDGPNTKVFSTLARVFDSSAGRKHMLVEHDAEHGIIGKTTKREFLKPFARLVSDVALGKQSSRTLNTNKNIDEYFTKTLGRSERATKKRGSFVPSDIITNRTGSSRTAASRKSRPKAKRSREISKTVMPRTFTVRAGSDRLVDIRRELVRLKRDDFPNAGSVLLRVFFELAVVDYLERSGLMDELKSRLGAKALQYGTPTMKQMVPEVRKLARKVLTKAKADRVEKAVKLDKAAPFTLSDMHGFVHQNSEFPGGRDILQFWTRIEPILEFMLSDVEADEDQ